MATFFLPKKLNLLLSRSHSFTSRRTLTSLSSTSTISSPSPPNRSLTQSNHPTLFQSGNQTPIADNSNSSPTLPINPPSQSPLELESGNQTVPNPNASNKDDAPFWKRTGKVVQTVGLGGIGASITLIVNEPDSASKQLALYTAYLTVVCLGLFSSLGLSFFSIIKTGSPAVGRVQQQLIYLTLFFVAVAGFLRLIFELPLANVAYGLASVCGVAGFVLIYLYFCFHSEA